MQGIREFIVNTNEATSGIFEGGLFTAIVVWLIALIAAPVLLKIERGIEHTIVKKRGKREFPILGYLFRFLIYIFAALAVLLQIIPLKATTVSLLATSGVLAVILGFASQQACSGLVSGLFISIFRPFVIGDRITISELKLTGEVEDITLNHTVIRDFRNNRIIVPNAQMNAYVIENNTAVDNRVCNFLDLSIAYSADVDKATELVRGACERHGNCIDNRDNPDEGHKVEVYLTELGSTSITLRAFVWSKDAAAGYSMMCDLRRTIKALFAENGVEIPFPTTNVIIRDK